MTSTTLVADDPAKAAHLTGEAGLFPVLAVVGVAAFVLRRCDWTPRSTPAVPA